MSNLVKLENSFDQQIECLIKDIYQNICLKNMLL